MFIDLKRILRWIYLNIKMCIRDRYKTFDKALMDSMKKTYEKDTRKTKIFGKLKAEEGEPLVLKLWLEKGTSISVEGNIVQKAENRPTTEADLRKQISKMGSTPFELAKLDIICGDGIYAVSYTHLQQ